MIHPMKSICFAYVQDTAFAISVDEDFFDSHKTLVVCIPCYDYRTNRSFKVYSTELDAPNFDPEVGSLIAYIYEGHGHRVLLSYDDLVHVMKEVTHE